MLYFCRYLHINSSVFSGDTFGGSLPGGGGGGYFTAGLIPDPSLAWSPSLIGNTGSAPPFSEPFGGGQSTTHTPLHYTQQQHLGGRGTAVSSALVQHALLTAHHLAPPHMRVSLRSVHAVQGCTCSLRFLALLNNCEHTLSTDEHFLMLITVGTL